MRIRDKQFVKENLRAGWAGRVRTSKASERVNPSESANFPLGNLIACFLANCLSRM